MSSSRVGLDSKVFAARGPLNLRTGSEAPLMGLHSLSKTKPETELPIGAPPKRGHTTGAFLEVHAPSALPISGQRHSWRASHGPTAFVSRFSQPLDAFIRPKHPSLISCQSRSWGSPFRALLLATQAASVSGAVALWPLETALWNLGTSDGNRRSCLGSAPTPIQRPDEAQQNGPGFRAFLRTRVRHYESAV